MSNHKFASGPWRVTEGDARSSGYIRRVNAMPPEYSIARIVRNSNYAEREANTKLIVAAPDLLEALETIIEGFEQGVFIRDTSRDGEPGFAMRMLPIVSALAKAQAAIKKATS